MPAILAPAVLVVCKLTLLLAIGAKSFFHPVWVLGWHSRNTFN